MQGNHTKANYASGIENEVGYDGIARYNIVETDGLVPGKTNASMWWGCGIYSYASQNTQIYNNTILNSTNGICGVSMLRNPASGNRGTFELRNLSVHDNVIVQTNGGSATGVVSDSGYYLRRTRLRGTTSGLQTHTNSRHVGRYVRLAGGDQLQEHGLDSVERVGPGYYRDAHLPHRHEFPQHSVHIGRKVQAISSTPVWSLPTTTSTLVITQPSGAQGAVTNVAGPIRTAEPGSGTSVFDGRDWVVPRIRSDGSLKA